VLVPTDEREDAEGLRLQTQAGLQRKRLSWIEIQLPYDIRAFQIGREGMIRSQREADGVGGEVGS